MKKLIFFFLLSGPLVAHGQEAKIIKLGDLENIMTSQSEGTIIINFWATWCAPCVKELPVFEKLNDANDPGIALYLINLDYADKINRVNTFLSRKKMRSTVLLLDEIDYNNWIEKVDKDWGGAIPATLILNAATGKRKFVDRELNESELNDLINEVK